MQELLSFLRDHHLTYHIADESIDTLPFMAFCLDGRHASEGGVFIAIEKNAFFIEQAINNGCIAVLTHPYFAPSASTFDVPVVVVEALEEKLVLILQCFYQLIPFYPKLIGITGTNGKTSTAHFVAQLLHQADFQVGIMGTLGNGIFMPKHDLPTSALTTLDTIGLYQQLANFNQQQVDVVVMEVSSHAIAQDRIMGLIFNVVCFTNLSPEHLDYHQDMAHYFACKTSLFSNYVGPHTRYVINQADAYGRRLSADLYQRKAICNSAIMTCHYHTGSSSLPATHHSDLRLVRDEQNLSVMQGQNEVYRIHCSLSHDVEYQNLLCALAISLALGERASDMMHYTQNLYSVAGRMQQVSSMEDDIQVIIDYAHTADALDNALGNISQEKSRNADLICVFGCGGNRDTSKRKKMAEVASVYCSKLYITDDNPRNENPQLIRQQIIDGILTNHTSYVEVADRSLAIEQAIMDAKPSDMVLIAGKGHEKYQLIKGEKHPFDDVSQAQNALLKRAKYSSYTPCQ